MKRILAKVGRFFCSWGFLKFVLWTVTIVILFYIEEDWRGARAWAATKAEWETKGESFDGAKFIPASIPDEQNLGALPLFQMETATGDDAALRHALRAGLPGNTLPTGGRPNGSPDMDNARAIIAANYAEAFKGQALPPDALAQFDALYPCINDLLAAAKTRPQFRLSADYTIYPPANRSLGLITGQIKLSQVLKWHALFALEQKRPDLALDDIKLNFQLISGVERDPSLVAGLVAIGMQAIFNPVITQGLTLHSWNDSQLEQIQAGLARLDYLALYRFVLRGDAAMAVIPNIDFFKSRPKDLAKLMDGYYDPSKKATVISVFNGWSWPDGWWDQNKKELVDLIFTDIQYVDPVLHRAYPEKANAFQKQLDRIEEKKTALTPWNLWVTISAPPLLNALYKFAIAQVHVDEARIACALERYHLVHRVYPDTLDALSPGCIPELPRDVVNGDPYRYHLRPDGTYLLYSVGWNLTDEGGETAYYKENPKHIDYKNGDWSWPP